MKIFICSFSVFCLFYINAQKPPLKATVNCNSVVGVYYEDFTDKDGVSLKYSNDLCDCYYKGKLYTGKVKSCANNKMFAIENYVNGRLEGESFSYYDNGNLRFYTVYGKDTTEGDWALETDDDASKKNGKPTFREVLVCDGVLNGEDLNYQENGKLYWKGSNLNGNREGKWFFYDEKGAVMEVRTYKGGVEINCSGKCD